MLATLAISQCSTVFAAILEESSLVSTVVGDETREEGEVEENIRWTRRCPLWKICQAGWIANVLSVCPTRPILLRLHLSSSFLTLESFVRNLCNVLRRGMGDVPFYESATNVFFWMCPANKIVAWRKQLKFFNWERWGNEWISGKLFMYGCSLTFVSVCALQSRMTLLDFISSGEMELEILSSFYSRKKGLRFCG